MRDFLRFKDPSDEFKDRCAGVRVGDHRAGVRKLQWWSSDTLCWGSGTPVLDFRTPVQESGDRFAGVQAPMYGSSGTAYAGVRDSCAGIRRLLCRGSGATVLGSEPLCWVWGRLCWSSGTALLKFEDHCAGSGDHRYGLPQ